MEIPLLIITYIELEPKIEAKKKFFARSAAAVQYTHSYTAIQAAAAAAAAFRNSSILYCNKNSTHTHTA